MRESRALKKLNHSAGFSLAEVLVAVLILLMVSSVVAGGIPVARNAYEKVTVSANAQVMLSTAVSALRNEIGTASDVKVGAAGNTLTYYSSRTGSYTKLYKGTGKEGILLEEYISNPDSTPGVSGVKTNDTSRQLVTGVAGGTGSETASNRVLYVTYESIDPKDATNPDVVTFKGLVVYRGDDTTTKRAELDSLSIRVVSSS